METAPERPGPRWLTGGASVAEPSRPAQPNARGESGASAYTPLLVSRRPLGCLIEIAETLVLTIIIFLVIQAFVAQPYRVQQESMRLTLEEDQYVLVDKLTPNFDEYSRGDIVVFQPIRRDGSCSQEASDGSEAVPFIKRVIGEPGDLVEIHDDAVFVNGTQVLKDGEHTGATPGQVLRR
jgi:signal peptidase I